MNTLSPATQNHVARLNEDMLDLEHNKRRLTKGQRLATKNRRQHKVYYGYLLRKQELLVKHNRAQREELYSKPLFFLPK